MRRFYLIRHAQPAAAADTLYGRLPGIGLSSEGKRQAQALARFFAEKDITSILTSPLERCLETARAITDQREPHICKDLLEIDYGSWSGRSFTELQQDRTWRRWNSDRGRTQTAGGDSLARVATSLIDLLSTLPEDGCFLLVTHAEIIRCFTALALNLSLAQSIAFEIDHASVSRFEEGDGYMRCLGLNLSALP
jgi:probable phosphoglycerate mutase